MPEKGGFLMVGNYQSKFDPYILSYVFRKQKLVFVSREEILEIPLLGRFMKKGAYIPYAKEYSIKSAGMIKDAVATIFKEKASIAIYPEYPPTPENRMGAFSSHVFKIAKQTAIPIVVVSVNGVNIEVKGTISSKDISMLENEELYMLVNEMIRGENNGRKDGINIARRAI